MLGMLSALDKDLESRRFRAIQMDETRDNWHTIFGKWTSVARVTFNDNVDNDVFDNIEQMCTGRFWAGFQAACFESKEDALLVYLKYR